MSRVVASMERTNCVTLELVLLLIFCLCNTSVQCQTRPINHISAEPPSPSRAPELKNKFQKIILSILFGIVTGLICSILFAFTVRCFIRYISRTPILKGPVIFSPKIDPKTLQLALANENQLLGSSPNGKYYKTMLDNGLTIAVKRLEPFENGSPQAQSKSVKRRMQQELEMLASLRHRNLMSLRAFVRESDRLCLVYDYMHIGSLEDVMKRVRENQLELRWELRLRIAVGIVKGLQFLHFSCNPTRFLHYNLKPSNVMLDAEFEPRLADCGLAKLVMPNLDRAPSGYDAPECFQNCRYTDKSDVFSFGVILGVLLMGRDPMDPFFEESASGGSFGRWLRHLQHAGEAREALDKRIIGEEVEEDEMLMAVRISVVCQSDLPADRPSSDELVSMLTQLNSF
ncbi:LOW QUALITY PROTEIN: inactive leucine-rich repeat receptor-like protein kinase CORYNE [Actinidia eriantha]|uniref:LOW QUALITY PROTEIN: inactive leucine-rich repeat receptor-like protein kinase CORYNE n=1 Tax=Actinidia eriantha TaxID=165200 RepID=UPI002582D532|nr:LOW QUALITY PROTEIN: inactive leucine-rich repeat receptor-like protein kinase CORYNE [Actinidia eriantha]